MKLSPESRFPSGVGPCVSWRLRARSAAGKHIDYRVEERLRAGIRFEDLTARNIWPSAESDLRRAPTSARPAAHFDAAWDNEVGRVEGYRLAAEVLVRHMVGHRGDRDFLIYPFIRKSC